MKYCEKCFEIVAEGAECSCHNSKLSQLKPQSSVKIAQVKGNLRAIVEPALREKGIPCELFNPEMDIYTQYNPKVNAETEFSLLVPFEFYNVAFDVCVGLGLVSDEDKIQLDPATQAEPSVEPYDAHLNKEKSSKAKILSFLSIVLLIILVCLAIWGVDIIAALVKNSRGIPVVAKLFNGLLL